VYCILSHHSTVGVCVQLAAVPPSHRQSEEAVEAHAIGRPTLTEQTQSR